jgi:hypothetical protein
MIMRFYGGKALDEVPKKEENKKQSMDERSFFWWQLAVIPILLIRKLIANLYYKLLENE